MEVTEHCSTCIIDEGTWILITACMWYTHCAALMSTGQKQLAGYWVIHNSICNGHRSALQGACCMLCGGILIEGAENEEAKAWRPKESRAFHTFTGIRILWGAHCLQQNVIAVDMSTGYPTRKHVARLTDKNSSDDCTCWTVWSKTAHYLIYLYLSCAATSWQRFRSAGIRCLLVWCRHSYSSEKVRSFILHVRARWHRYRRVSIHRFHSLIYSRRQICTARRRCRVWSWLKQPKWGGCEAEE